MKAVVYNKYTVYLHRNTINNKVYVGITSTTPESRWGRQGSGYRGSYFMNAIDKYGWDNFEHIILESNLTKEEAIIFEKKYIKDYKSNDRRYGYNLTSGGEHTEFTDIAKERIRQKCIGRKASEKTREILRLSHIGKRLSKETIMKCVESRKGFHHTEESKQKMREKALGRKFSKEHIINLSLSHKGKKYSEEYKLNMRKVSPLSVRVMCVETGEVFYSYNHAAESLFNRIKASENISKCARGLKKSYRGLHFIKLGKEI